MAPLVPLLGRMLTHISLSTIIYLHITCFFRIDSRYQLNGFMSWPILFDTSCTTIQKRHVTLDTSICMPHQILTYKSTRRYVGDLQATLSTSNTEVSDALFLCPYRDKPHDNPYRSVPTQHLALYTLCPIPQVSTRNPLLSTPYSLSPSASHSSPPNSATIFDSPSTSTADAEGEGDAEYDCCD